MTIYDSYCNYNIVISSVSRCVQAWYEEVLYLCVHYCNGILYNFMIARYDNDNQ